VDSQEPRFADSVDDGEPAKLASLQLELRVPERQMVAAFREAFLRWLNDRAGPFARLGGQAEGLSLDELPDGADPQGRSLLRLSVSWSFAPRPTSRSPIVLPPPTAVTVAPPTGPAALEQYVFFPDPPEAAAPIFHALSVPLQARQVPARQLRLESPLAESMLRTAGRGVGAVRALASLTPVRFGLPGLTIRSPLPVHRSRAWGAALLGTAAVAVGFAAGSIYLATSARAPHEDIDPPLAAVRPVAAEPIVATAAMIPAPAMPLGQSLPRVERTKEPVDVLAGSRLPQVLPPTSSALGLADAEVTTSRPRTAPVEQDLVRRPGVVVVRASEVTGTSGTDRRVKGALLVKSDPQGAEVSINGVVHGRTPLVIRDLGAGSRVLRLDLPGYERWSWAVAVVANRRTPVTVKLQPEVRGAGQY